MDEKHNRVGEKHDDAITDDMFVFFFFCFSSFLLTVRASTPDWTRGVNAEQQPAGGAERVKRFSSCSFLSLWQRCTHLVVPRSTYSGTTGE